MLSFHLFIQILHLINLLFSYSVHSYPTKRSPINTANGQTSKDDLMDREPDYLWYGIDVQGDEKTGRQTIDATILFNKTLQWGLPINLIQLKNRPSQYQTNSAFFAPSIAQYEEKTHSNVAIGADFMLSCYNDDLFKYQHSLNLNCTNTPGCQNSFFVFTLWGTIGQMDYEKDAILARFCGIVNILGGSDCIFPFSNACKPILYQDLSQQADQRSIESGQIVDIGIANSYEQITGLMEAYANQSDQQLTLPDGTLTSSSTDGQCQTSIAKSDYDLPRKC